MGYDSDFRVVEPFPGWMTGVELQPSTSKAKVFRFIGSPNPVYAVSNSFEQARIDQPRN